MTNAIEVAGVTKAFRRSSETGKTIKDRIFSFRSATVETFNALEDVSFEVPLGHTLGILGHNGSGKSTLLKCIAGTITPTAGTVGVRGSLSALLELGAGFHPDLTGRENVYLNGSILGFSRSQVDAIFDDIVDFSEIPDFIDTQVKHYSSGMFARLGFAVAVNLEPDVLLVDEVLAVGDEAFQRKCLERVRTFQADGRTVVIVTHSPEMVSMFCEDALVLNDGKMIHFGGPGKAATAYREALEGRQPTAKSVEAGASRKPLVQIEEMEIRRGPSASGPIRPGDDISIVVNYVAHEEMDDVRGRLILISHDGILFSTLSTQDLVGGDLSLTAGPGQLTFHFNNLPILDGRYEVTFVFQDASETKEFDRSDAGTSFSVSTGGAYTGRVVMDVAVEIDGAMSEPKLMPAPVGD